MQSWVVPWAMFGWAALIAAMLAFEVFTLRWNTHNPGRRANLSAYVTAFFAPTNRRRLKYHAGAAVLIAVFVFFTGHFLEWWSR